MDLEVRPIGTTKSVQEANDITYAQDRISSLTWVTRLTILAILIGVAGIVLNSIHLSWQSLSLVKALLGGSIAVLLAGALVFYWARQATTAYKSSGELFQPRVNERTTKFVFIACLILAGTALTLWVNLFVQRAYPNDYAVAQATSNDFWTRSFGDSSFDSVDSFFTGSFIAQLVFFGILFFYFLFVARTAFKCLKWDNQAISSLVFIGCVLLLAFGLCLVFYSHHALAYGDYPQIKAHFPIWNLRSLFLVGILISSLSLVGFLADHRSWRIGFLILGFLLLFGLVLLANFTGFAFKHSRTTYNYYKGTQSIDTCINRLYVADANELQAAGCPAKYVVSDQCSAANRVSVWEKYNPHPQGSALQGTLSETRVQSTGAVPLRTAPTNATTTETPAQETPAETPAETGEETVAPAETTPVETPAETPAEIPAETEETTTTTTPAEIPAETGAETEETTTTTTPAETTTIPAETGAETEETTEEPTATPAETTTTTTTNQTNTTTTATPTETVPVETPAETEETTEESAATTTTPAETTTTPAETGDETEETTEEPTATPAETTTTTTNGTNTTTTTTTTTTPAEAAETGDETEEAPATTTTTTTTTPAEAAETGDETEETEAGAEVVTPAATNQTTTTTNTTNTTTTTTTPAAETEEDLEATADMLTMLTDEYVDAGSYCLNTNCCGILGELYVEDLLTVANFGLLTILAGVLILIGCAYFWYVNWIDSARNKGRDYIYLFIMIAIIAGYAFIQANVSVPLVTENLGPNGVHQ